MIKAVAGLVALVLTAPFGTETIDVTGYGKVDLATFDCRDIRRSTLIQRACYDGAERQLIVSIKGRYEQYCGLAADTFGGFMGAPSMGRFYIQNIRGVVADERYTCRTGRLPAY